MVKIFYNEDGWVCERYPYNLPVTEECKFIEVAEEEYLKTLSCVIGNAWKVVDGQFEVSVYDENERKLSNARQELRKLEDWFSDIYDMQVKQAERCARLGIAYSGEYGTVAELDEQAVTNAKRIKEIRTLLA